MLLNEIEIETVERLYNRLYRAKAYVNEIYFSITFLYEEGEWNGQEYIPGKTTIQDTVLLDTRQEQNITDKLLEEVQKL